MKAGSTNAFGPTSGAGAITVSSGAALDLSGQAISSTGALTLNGTGINNGGALMNSGAAASYAGLVTIGSNTSIIGGSGTIALGNTGIITGTGKALTLGGAAGGNIASIIGTTTGTLTKQDAGTWTLNGANTYTGVTTLSAGVLKAGNANAFGPTVGAGAISVASGAALDLNGKSINSTATLTLNGTGISGGGALMNSSGSARYAGLISVGSGGVSITNSSGTLTLAGNIGGATAGSAALGPLTISDTASGVSVSGSINMGSFPLEISAWGGIDLSGNITTNGGSVLLKARGNITQGAVLVSTSGGNVTYWADSDGNGMGQIQLTNGASGASAGISAGAGNIVLGGGTGATAADGSAAADYTQGSTTQGILVGQYASLSGANITLLGRGGAYASNSSGVALGQSSSVVATGSVVITGIAGGTSISPGSQSSNNIGVSVASAIIESTGASGSVTITGTGGGNTLGLSNYGVAINGGGGYTGTVRTRAGAVTIQGTEGAGAANYGLSLSGGTYLGGTSQTGTLNLQANSMDWSGFGSITLQTDGAVTIAPVSTSFSGLQTFGTNVALAGASQTGPSALTIGKAGNTAALTLNNSISVAGPINLMAGYITLAGNLTTTGTGNINGLISLTSYGGLGIQQLPTSPTRILTAPFVSVTGASNAVWLGSNNVIGTVAISGATTARVVNAGALTVGTAGAISGISASGTIVAATNTGDLTIAGDIVTTSTSTYATNLEAGFNNNPRDASGGNIVLSGTPSFSTGVGGVTRFFTGSVAGSTSVATLVGSGTERFRYGSDSVTSNFTKSLISGLYVIYREQPTVTWSSAADQNITYGTQPVIDTANTVSGLVNGDLADQNVGLRKVSDNTLMTLNTRGYYDAGSYVQSRTVGPKALGYATTNPAITISQAPLTITANDKTKTYDGGAFIGGNGVIYSGFVAGETASSVLGVSVYYTGSSQGAVNASTTAYAITPARVTPIIPPPAGTPSLNYSYTYVSGNLWVNPVPLTVSINNDARFVTGQDNIQTAPALSYGGASYKGFVANQTPSVLGGALSITRSNSGPDGNTSGSNTLAGVYTGVLMGSGLTSSNYSITYLPGKYTIVPADQLLVKVTNTSTTYGSDPVFSVTSAQYVRRSDNTVVDLTNNVSLTGNALTLNDGASGQTAFNLGALLPTNSTSGSLNVGAYQLGSTIISNTSSNYNNTVTVTGALQVNPKTVTPSLTSSASRSYDGTTGMNGVIMGLSGLVGTDAVVVGGNGAYASKNAGINVNYTIANLTLTGVDASLLHLFNNAQ